MAEQAPLFPSDRVYENERASWDVTEAYYSRPEYVLPLLAYLEECGLAQTGRIVEPCVGGGALVDGLAMHWNGIDLDVLTGDIRDVGADWIGDWTGDRGTWTWNRDVRAYLRDASLVLTNPAFSKARAIVEASWEHCPDAVVAILQRASWYEPTADRCDFLRDHNPDQITIGRCEFFRPDGTSAGKGDSCSYTWYVYGPDRQGPRKGHHRLRPWKEM